MWICACYDHGLGCEQDKTKAFEWYEKSANLGDSMAMYNLGRSYQLGYGVSQDLVKAKQWFTKTVEQGDDSLNNDGVEEHDGKTVATVDSDSSEDGDGEVDDGKE